MRVNRTADLPDNQRLEELHEAEACKAFHPQQVLELFVADNLPAQNSEVPSLRYRILTVPKWLLFLIHVGSAFTASNTLILFLKGKSVTMSLFCAEDLLSNILCTNDTLI